MPGRRKKWRAISAAHARDAKARKASSKPTESASLSPDQNGGCGPSIRQGTRGRGYDMARGCGKSWTRNDLSTWSSWAPQSTKGNERNPERTRAMEGWPAYGSAIIGTRNNWRGWAPMHCFAQISLWIQFHWILLGCGEALAPGKLWLYVSDPLREFTESNGLN